jgi:hypothetical protein
MIIDAGHRRLAPFPPTRYTLPKSLVYLTVEIVENVVIFAVFSAIPAVSVAERRS